MHSGSPFNAGINSETFQLLSLDSYRVPEVDPGYDEFGLVGNFVDLLVRVVRDSAIRLVAVAFLFFVMAVAFFSMVMAMADMSVRRKVYEIQSLGKIEISISFTGLVPLYKAEVKRRRFRDLDDLDSRGSAVDGTRFYHENVSFPGDNGIEHGGDGPVIAGDVEF